MTTAVPPNSSVPSLPSIPLFSLYGEHWPVEDAEFVHVEDIQSRSRQYAWRIGRHLHKGLFQAVFVVAGTADVRLEDDEREVNGPCVVIVPPTVVHGFVFRPDTDGLVLTFAGQMLFDRSAAHRERPGDSFFQDLFLHPAVSALSTATMRRIVEVIGQMGDELRWPQVGRPLMLDWLLRTALLLVHREQAADSGPFERRRAELFTRFRGLIEEHYLEHWPTSRYAEILGTSESRLNRICREVVAKSAFEVAQDRLLLEARRRLSYVALPATSIAYELGFRDPAYFCRFFKKRTGETPAAFRRRRG
jgi:AraC family transcriptional activator of pobA